MNYLIASYKSGDLIICGVLILFPWKIETDNRNYNQVLR